MDDFVINVRQVAQFPMGVPVSGDAFLYQSGGLGGPYLYTTFDGLTAAMSARIDQFQIQLSTYTQALADLSNMWTAQFTATMQYITDNTVWSFNGRRGDIQLALWDIMSVGGAPLQSPHFTNNPTAPTPQFAEQSDDQIATTLFVQMAAARQINLLLKTQPFVFGFNGRTGAVCLTFDDVQAVILDQQPMVETPLSSDVSNRIATTQFVFWQVDDLRMEVEALEEIVYTEIDQSSLATKAYVDANFAPINNASLTGFVTAPTADVGTNNAQIATTAYVMNALQESVAGVVSWNGRSGNVTLTAADLNSVGGALLNSPAFIGNPTAPTQPAGTTNTTLATTAFVMNQITAIDAGVVTFNNRGGAVTLLLSDVEAVGGAPIASPVFSGIPAGPTANPGTNTAQLATTQFVTQAIAAISVGVTSWEGRAGAVTMTSNDISARGGALVASPAFTGTPSGPTPPPGDSSTRLATTAFVMNALASASVVTSFNTRTGAVTLTAADINALPAASINSAQIGGTFGSSQIVGTTTNDNAAPAGIGYYIESNVLVGAAIGLTTGVGANVTSISLPAGDWDVSGCIAFNPVTSGTTVGAVGGGFSRTSATAPLNGASGATYNYYYNSANIPALTFALNTTRFSLSATTTIFLVAFANFGAAGLQAFGSINARRVR